MRSLGVPKEPRSGRDHCVIIDAGAWCLLAVCVVGTADADCDRVTVAVPCLL